MIWGEDAALAQIKSTSTTIDIEELKAGVAEREQAVNDYSEGLHEII